MYKTRIKNGIIITTSKILYDYDLIIGDKKIINIIKKNEQYDCDKVYDAHGSFVMPGFIDIHNDYFEAINSLRPNALFDFSLILNELEKEFISHGITTVFHSFAIAKPKKYHQRQMRYFSNIKKVLQVIKKHSADVNVMNHKFHLRIETNISREINWIKKELNKNSFDLISIMNHDLENGPFKDADALKKYLQGMNLPDTEKAYLERLKKEERLSIDQIRELVAIARANNIPVASHDDNSIKKIKEIYSLGISISEFPTNIDVAKFAKKIGMHTLAGAPNVVLNRSQNENLLAIEGISNNAIDILCSDYFPASMLHAVFILYKEYNIPLNTAVNLVTINPASATFIDSEVGSIDIDKNADLIIVSDDGENPMIQSVFVSGKEVLKLNYLKKI